MPPSKYNPGQWQRRLDRAGIVFERPINHKNWPDRYRTVFSVILEIGRQRMEDYARENANDVLSLRDKQKRAWELVNAAQTCLTTFRNEDDWRERTEDKILARFNAEVVCRCGNYFWYSEYATGPESEDEAVRRRLLRRRKRGLCQCGPLQRSPADINAVIKPAIFSSVRNTEIGQTDIDESEQEIPTTRKFKSPDRVIGLNRTDTFESHLALRRLSNNHTLFPEKDVFYPFLVLEAKRELGIGPGWTYIEHQTAFPIRACLNLQENLRKETGVDLKPLVWFFAFRGEEWRLYGAVPDNDKTRIFDLWHGTILSEDGALQLCLIIDYICTWARTQYREQILACLAAGSEALRRFTSPLPSQVSEADSGSIRGRESVPLRSSVGLRSEGVHVATPIVTPGSTATTMVNLLPTQLKDGIRVQFNSQEDVHNWLRFIDESPPWAHIGTIRHANVVQLVFQELNLPQDECSLRYFLTTCLPNNSIQDSAKRFLATLRQSSLCITTSSQTVYLRTRLKRTSWQIERYILWITCTSKAATELYRIAEGAIGEREITERGNPHDCQCLFLDLNRFTAMSGREGLEIAILAGSMRQQCFQLCPDANGQGHLKA